MNKDLLFTLYGIHSPSGNEKKMRKFIKRYIIKNCGDCMMEQDEHGNLLVVKGKSDTYPCLASHIDQVQKNHSKDFTVLQVGDDVLAWSPKSHEQQGLGADDKNGIFICLELLKEFDVMKCAFFVGEEVGCVGSRQVNLDFFKDCRFIVEPDRMNGHDLITSMFCGDVCSAEFIKDIGADAFGYKETEGSVTDVGELVERGVGISCLNLSCGYYHAHTSNETTILSELENCLKCVRNIVEQCTKVYPFVYERRTHQIYGYGYGSYSRKGGGASSNKKSSYYIDDYLHDEWYDDECYQTDRDTMEDIVTNDPSLTFGEIVHEYSYNFYTTDYDILRDIYDDIVAMYGYEDYYGSAFDHDEEDVDENPVEKEITSAEVS